MASGDPIDSNYEEVSREEEALRGGGAEEAAAMADGPQGDPCNSYEWSIFFLLLFVLSIVGMLFHLYTLWKRRSNLSAYDILFLFFFFATVVQFGPMMSQVLHSGHSVYHFSQSGCKLLFYTDYGMRHVVAFLVICYFLYAYAIVFCNFDSDNLDGKMRANIPWLIIAVFAIEGLFGMVPAIYVDVGPSNMRSCVWTSTMDLTIGQIVSMEIILRPITPYLLPVVILAYPLVRVTLVVRAMDESKIRSTLYSVLPIYWTYGICNIPYAILLVAESIGHLYKESSMSWVTVCNLKWFFFLLHQSWFLIVPSCVLALDVDRGNLPVGSEVAMAAWDKVKTQVGDTRKRLV